MVIESYSGFAQRYNMMIGVLICAFSTSLLFLIMPSGIFFMADIFLVAGNCIGLYITFKNRKESQKYIITGIIVGVAGSVLSILLISLFEWILFSLTSGFDFILFLNYTLFLLLNLAVFYVPVGMLLGWLFGNRFRKRELVIKESPLF